MEHPKITTREAWTSRDLEQREGWRIDLSAEELEEIDRALTQVAKKGLDLPEITVDTFPLPNLSQRLSQVQDRLENDCGIAWLRGITLDRYSDDEAAKLFWGICRHLGTPLPQSADGDRVFHVRDEGFRDDDPKARGPSSNKKLTFHTDRCDVIGFCCLRQAESGGDNDIVSSVQIYNEMLEARPELVEALMSPYRYQRHNVDTGNELPYYEQPVFSLHHGRFAAFLMRVLIERAYAAPDSPAMPHRQLEALNWLADHAEQTRLRFSFRQAPGDLVFINNLTTLHRRTAFRDAKDPSLKRHLLRIWLSVPNSRPLDPAFSPTFGAVEAGAIRGGMRVSSESN